MSAIPRICICLLLIISKTIADPTIRELLQIWQPELEIKWNNLSIECNNDMNQFTNSLHNRQLWSSSMLDSTGYIGHQFLKGNNFWLGSRTQCLEINEEYHNKNESYPKTKFVVIKLKIELHEPLLGPTHMYRIFEAPPPERLISFGLCLTESCADDKNINILFKRMINFNQNLNQYRNISVQKIRILPENYNSSTSTILLIVICSSVLIISIIATILDVKLTEQDKISNLFYNIILCFSLKRNTEKMFDLNKNKASINVLHGIKVFGMIWIILLHTVVLFSSYFTDNPSFRHIVGKDFLYAAVPNGTYSVDTFFFISGFLLTYLLFKNNINKKQDNFLQTSLTFIWIILYRLIRLAPPYIITILISIVSVNYFKSISVFDELVTNPDNCINYWWRNLLYINNFYPEYQTCIPWTWYLTVDTQVYILATPLLLLYLNSYRKTSVTIGIGTLISSWIFVGYISYTENYIPNLEKPIQLINELYNKPWSRIGPFWTGIILGWLLIKNKIPNINKLCCIIGWILCICALCLIVLIINFNMNLITATLYVTFSRTIWTICIGWIVVTSIQKKAGIIGKIFEYPIFGPLARATYCTYLIQYPLMEMIALNLENPVTLSRGLMTVFHNGFILISFTGGILISILFESPTIALLSLAYKNNIKYKLTKSNENTTADLKVQDIEI